MYVGNSIFSSTPSRGAWSALFLGRLSKGNGPFLPSKRLAEPQNFFGCFREKTFLPLVDPKHDTSVVKSVVESLQWLSYPDLSLRQWEYTHFVHSAGRFVCYLTTLLQLHIQLHMQLYLDSNIFKCLWTLFWMCLVKRYSCNIHTHKSLDMEKLSKIAN